MTELPTLHEAAASQTFCAIAPQEALRVITTAAGVDVLPQPADEGVLQPFTAWSLWFFAWAKKRIPGLQESAFLLLLRQLKRSKLPRLLDEQWMVWQDEDCADPVEGFDIIFCDGFSITWTGRKHFFNIVQMTDTPVLTNPPLEKLGMDAIVLFVRGVHRLLINRERTAKDGNPRDTGETGTNREIQGST